MIDPDKKIEIEEVSVTSEFKRSSDILLEKYPPKPIKGQISWGYKKSDQSSLAIPVFHDLKLLDEGLDRLDSGATLKHVTDWINSFPVHSSLSLQGLRKIWIRERPDSILNLQREKREKKIRSGKKYTPLTRQERLEKKKKEKIAAQKRKITFAKKRLSKITEDLSEINKYKDSNVVEIDYSVLDYSQIPEEEQDAEIIFKPNPGPQTEFLSAPQLEVLYGGSAGGGKSFALLADPMRHFGNKNFNGLLLRRTNDELRELKWKSQELYKQAYPDAVWREKDSEWRFPSGAKLWMSYLERDEDVLRYQGQAFTWIGFDELTQYSTPFAWNYLRSRLRSSDPEMAKNLSMRGTTNPGGPGHSWVKRMFIDPAPANKAFWATDIETGETVVYPKGHVKEGQPVFRRRFIPASLYDNPYLSEDGIYEANLLALPEQQRRQLLEGDWNVADGAAFSEFRSNIHTCEPFEIPREWRRFRSCDYGYSSFSAVHWYAVNPVNNQLVVYRELYVTKKEADELAKLILSLERSEKISYGVLDSSVWRKTGDPGPSIAERMIRAGCRWRPSDRSPGSRKAGRNRLHLLLKQDELGDPGIIFFNTCRQIISDLPVIPTDPKGGDDIDDRYASDHAYDSIRYGIMTRPKPGNPWEEMERSKSVDFSSPVSNTFGY